jgi:hypothetical protein
LCLYKKEGEVKMKKDEKRKQDISVKKREITMSPTDSSDSPRDGDEYFDRIGRGELEDVKRQTRR